MATVGEALKEARYKRGFTQLELAERADVSLDWVRSVETGRTMNPRMDTLSKVAMALGVSAESLVLGKPEAVVDASTGRELISPERMQLLNVSFNNLQKLSPGRLKSMSEFIEVYLQMDDDEFQNPGSGK